MDNQNKAEIVKGLFSVGGQVLANRLQRNKRLSMMEEQKDMEIELARERARAARGELDQASSGSDPSLRESDPITRAERMANEYSQLLDELHESEQCKICVQIIEEIRELPVDEQAEVLPSFRELKKASERGADQNRLLEIINNDQVLEDVVSSRFGF